MILAVLINGDARLVCSEMWPGDTADVTTLIPVIDRLRRRFDIARVCLVADRGMISAEAVAELEARGSCTSLLDMSRSRRLRDTRTPSIARSLAQTFRCPSPVHGARSRSAWMAANNASSPTLGLGPRRAEADAGATAPACGGRAA